MNAERNVALVPYGSDPLETLASLLLQRHAAELPDLSRHVVLFAHPGSIPHFRRRLLTRAAQCGHGAVLAPWCGTLDSWLQENGRGDATLLDRGERELLLLEALESYPALKERFGAWALIDSLLALFDELNCYQRLPLRDAAELTALLAAGYKADSTLAPLRGEAELVYTLWSSWNAHLAAHGLSDRTLHRLASLADHASRNTGGPHHIYMIGAVDLTLPEAEWLKPLLAAGRATLILHGSTASPEQLHPDAAVHRCLGAVDLPVPTVAVSGDPYSRFIDHVFLTEPHMAERARVFARAHRQSPLEHRLKVYAAVDFEREARAIDLAVRRWRASGLRHIAIVTHDRKLARRARALLERANLALLDRAGWALSTTSAATVVMRWIECVDQDFACHPLLDFLKNPFTTLGLDRSILDALVHRFERQIVRRYNVTSGLQRYRRAAMHQPIETEIDSSAPTLTVLFDRLARAFAPVEALTRGSKRPLEQYLRALEQCLAETGLATTLSADIAGAEVLEVLRSQRRALAGHGPRFDWAEFRAWLERELERARFHPPARAEGVELLGLADTRSRRFDGIILAGCTDDALPGPPAASAFFNDGVRKQLGLPTRSEQLLGPLHDFRRLLEAAPQVLLTWRQSDDDEPRLPSPWVERIATFHRLAYGSIPADVDLGRLIAAPETVLAQRDAPLPAAVARPSPSLPRERVPTVLSASAHQRLLDCPYQFFAADGLALRTIDEAREEPEKSDYGRQVHRILQAFHGGASGLPGPWTGGPITTANRAAATELLKELGQRLLGASGDKRLSARGWRERWASVIDAYLDWLETRSHDWAVEATELTLERELAIGERALTLRGRIDRVDRGSVGVSIIDYKTGDAPKSVAIKMGEQSQLPFYALLHAGPVAEAFYVELGDDAVQTSNGARDEELATLVRRLEERLRVVMQRIHHGAPLSAWGDAETCRLCTYEGLCRKEMWHE